MIDTKEFKNKIDTTVKVDSYLIDFFDSIPNKIKGKNNKIVDMLLNNNIIAKDYPNNKITLHVYTSKNIEEKLKAKQKECGFPNFSHFINANLRKFYDDRHIYKEVHKEVHKVKIFKPKVNFVKFKRLVKKCKKNLMNGEYTSYDKNIKRCTLPLQQVFQKNLDFIKNGDNSKPNCYYELNRTKGWNIECDCIEAAMLNYIRYYEIGEWPTKYINGYNDLIGLNNTNFKQFENKIIEKNNVKKELDYVGNSIEQVLCFPEILYRFDNILKYYDFEIPNTDTYFYLWIYFVYHENKIYSEVNFKFNTNDEYAEKLLEKYTIDNIIYHYLKIDNNLLINNIFDNEVIEYLNNNELINLSNLYQKNIQEV